MTSEINIPWMAYTAELAAALSQRWVASGSGLESAMSAELNAAASSYRITVNVLYMAQAATIAQAQANYNVASANANHVRTVADANSLKLAKSTQADSQYNFQIAGANAVRDERIGNQTAARDFVSSGNAAAQAAALAAVAVAKKAHDQAAAHDFTVGKTLADGVHLIAHATDHQGWVATDNSAKTVFITAVSGANLAFAIGEAHAFRERTVASFSAVDNKLIAGDQTLAAAIHTLAIANGSPWAAYDDAVAAAQSTHGTAVYSADLALRTAIADADRLFEILGAQAERARVLSRAGARGVLNEATAGAYLASVTSQAGAFSARANVYSFPAPPDTVDPTQSLPALNTAHTHVGRVLTAAPDGPESAQVVMASGAGLVLRQA